MSIQPEKKVLNLFDIILMTVTANFGIRWIAIAAGIGPSSIIFWIFGALLFFLPLAIISAQMSRIYPEEGGIYAWVSHTLGTKNGFIVAWLYWVNNIFYYPAVLIFLASNFAYFIGRPELASNSNYIVLITIISFWLIVLISILGLKTSKYIVNIGGVFGLVLPAVLLIFFGTLGYFVTGQTATNFDLINFKPNGHLMGNLSSLAMIMFAMAGIEVTATFANRVKNPRRDLYLGLLIGSLLMFLMYMLGTLSMNVIANPNEIKNASGLMQVFSIVGNKFNIPWFSNVVAGLLTFAELAAISVWLLAPVIMFFKCTPKGVLPNWMHQADKNGTPINAILFQGVLVSIIIAITSLLPNVNAMYQILVLMATILYFIPYLFLAIAYVKSIAKLQINKYWAYALAYGVFFSILLGILVSFMPSSELKTTHDIILYEMELVSGPLLFIIIGILLYKFRKTS